MLVENKESIMEKRSSAVSLSDMEIFIFPDLMRALVIANIMSPIVWSWKEDPFFKGLEKMNTRKKIQRIKQFIMNKFDFNLDLDTWGLTSKDEEIKRFKDFVDLDTLKQSNALFGYEGDKYYFDMDIRKHFGLDSYSSEVIPYWKTETLEAMSNFYRKDGYTKGAGECVSFSTLYAASLFILGGIPLEDIYLLATPLHSQNFVDIELGIITNNRRIVTYNMWFNGTEISMKARRALENEQITFVGNNLGFVHRIYEKSTLPKEMYLSFKEKLNNYLESKVDYNLISSFLRHNTVRQMCFQFEHQRGGKMLYIEAEKVFPYEHGSPYLIGLETQSKLLDEIDQMDFYTEPIKGRVNLKDVEQTFKKSKYTVSDLRDDRNLLAQITNNTCSKITGILEEIIKFAKVDPRLPSEDEKEFVDGEAVLITPEMTRAEIIDYVHNLSETTEVGKLIRLAYREITLESLSPYMKAAILRNPVAVEKYKTFGLQDVYEDLLTYENVSVYDDPKRLGQPDEVINFHCGDGLELGITLCDIAVSRGLNVSLIKETSDVRVIIEGIKYSFKSNKELDLNIKKVDEFENY